MIEMGDDRGAGFFDDGPADSLAIFSKAVIGDHIRSVSACGLELGSRRIRRHHDGAGRAHMARRDCGGLRVVPRRVGHQTLRPLLLRQGENQVGRASDLERAAGLEILALENRLHTGCGVEGVRGQHGGAPGCRLNALGGLMHHLRRDFGLQFPYCTSDGSFLIQFPHGNSVRAGCD